MRRSEQENDLDRKVRRTRKKLESFSEARDILGEARPGTTASEDATVPSVASPMAVRCVEILLTPRSCCVRACAHCCLGCCPQTEQHTKSVRRGVVLVFDSAVPDARLCFDRFLGSARVLRTDYMQTASRPEVRFATYNTAYRIGPPLIKTGSMNSLATTLSAALRLRRTPGSKAYAWLSRLPAQMCSCSAHERL